MATATGQGSDLAHGPSVDAIDAELIRRSLRRYVEEAWPLVEPGRPFQPNWHIDVICEYLQAVTDREIRKLIINIPPRHMKSLAVAVFWPTWVWLSDPGSRWLVASHTQKFVVRDSVRARRILEHPGMAGGDQTARTLLERVGYRGLVNLLGDDWGLAGDQNLKTRYENDYTGYRLATSFGSKEVTGEGGDYRVVDDPHNPTSVRSDVERENDLTWHDETWGSRGMKPATDVEVLIMQRLHEGDLTGHLLEKGGWEHLCLPAEYEPNHPFVWPDDPRSERGELLWSDRVTREFLDVEKVGLGSYGYSGQYQQRPSPEEGGILKRDWWGFYGPRQRIKEAPPPKEIAQSWDMAFKDTDGSDYVVGQLWLRDLAQKYLLAMIRGHLDLPNTVTAVLAMDKYARDLGHGAHRIFIEDSANGPSVMQTLRKRVPGMIPVSTAATAKAARVHACAPQVEAGNAYLPEAVIPAPKAPTGEDGKALWEPIRTEALVNECANFPNVVHDDMVDALAQALVQMDSRADARKVRTGGYDKEKIRARL